MKSLAQKHQKQWFIIYTNKHTEEYFLKKKIKRRWITGRIQNYNRTFSHFAYAIFVAK